MQLRKRMANGALLLAKGTGRAEFDDIADEHKDLLADGRQPHPLSGTPKWDALTALRVLGRHA
jgi:hypothetical protein